MLLTFRFAGDTTDNVGVMCVAYSSSFSGCVKVLWESDLLQSAVSNRGTALRSVPGSLLPLLSREYHNIFTYPVRIQFSAAVLYFFPLVGTMDGMGNLFVGFCYAVLLMSAGEIAPVPLTASHHTWGQFLPQSWCIVQTVTVSNFEGRAVQSLQTVKTTLQFIDESGITLQESETLEVGGKIDERQPRTVKYDFFQEPIQENVQIKPGMSGSLKIGKNVIPCAVRIYESRTAGGHLTTTIWYSPYVYPYVIRVEKILRSIPDGGGMGGQIIRQSVTSVMETSALKTLRSSRRNKTYTLQTIEKVGNITKITDARCSWDVPGGLLESMTREIDAQNREIRRSVSRMSNYWVVPVPVEVIK